MTPDTDTHPHTKALETLRTSRNAGELLAARILVALYYMWPAEHFEVSAPRGRLLTVTHPERVSYEVLTRTVGAYLPVGYNVAYRLALPDHGRYACNPGTGAPVPYLPSEGEKRLGDYGPTRPAMLPPPPEPHGHPTPVPVEPPVGPNAVALRLANVARVHAWLGIDSDAMPSTAYAALAVRIEEIEQREQRREQQHRKARHHREALAERGPAAGVEELRTLVNDLTAALASIQIRYEGKTAQEWHAAVVEGVQVLKRRSEKCFEAAIRSDDLLANTRDLRGRAFLEAAKIVTESFGLEVDDSTPR